MPLVLENVSTQKIIGDRIEIADTDEERRAGLLGRKNLTKGEGLIITSCEAIHTFGMKFNIDVLFLDKNKTAVSYNANVRHSKIIKAAFPAEYAVELPVGTLESSKVKIGNKFTWYPKESKQESSGNPLFPEMIRKGNFAYPLCRFKKTS